MRSAYGARRLRCVTGKMTKRESTAVILCGGLSSRMGTPKHKLFLDRIVSQLEGFGVIALSVRDETQICGYDLQTWPDIVKDCEPLGGIYTALMMSETQYVFTTPCDVPDVTSDFVDGLFSQLRENDSCLVPVVGANVQPLTGIYSVSCAGMIRDSLRAGNFSVKKFLSHIDAHYVDINERGRELLRNINTPEEYKFWLNNNPSPLA